MYNTNFRPERPGWLKQLLSRIRLWLRQHGIFVHNLSDDDLQGILARAAQAEQGKRRERMRAEENGNVRYALNEEGKYFPAPDEWGTAYTSMSGKELEAIHFLLDQKDGFVPAAFHRDEIGDIDLVYGKIGKGIEDKGGYGLAHILKRHPDVDWNKIALTIQNGKVLPQAKTKRLIVSNDGKIVLRINQKGRNWVISAFSNASTEEISAVNRARGLPANLNPKGITTIGDLWPNVKPGNENNAKFSVREAPVIRLEVANTAQDAGNDLETKRQNALNDTLHALSPYERAYSEDFDDEWNTMSEAERQKIIEEDYEQAVEELDEDARKAQRKERGHALYEALENCIEQTAEYAEQLGYEIGKSNINSSATSGYLEVETPDGNEVLHLRFSDHEQPASGSFLTDKDGNSGRRKADLSTVIQDDAFDLSDVWRFLRENAGTDGYGAERMGTEDGKRFSVSPVYTGSAADYNKPSLHYVGSGEGAQVYGWGLYGSSSEKVARWYAENDADRKNQPKVLFDGKEQDPDWESYVNYDLPATEYEIQNRIMDDLRKAHGDFDKLLYHYESRKRNAENHNSPEDAKWYQDTIDYIGKNRDRFEYIPRFEPEAVYLNGRMIEPDSSTGLEEDRIEHNARDGHRAEVLDAPIFQRMLPVGQFSRQFRAHDRDDGRQSVGEVVDRIEDDRDGVGGEPHGGLERREENVGHDPDRAGPDNDPVTFVCERFAALFVSTHCSIFSL